MTISVDLLQLIAALGTVGSLVFGAMWVLLHRLVFVPLDTISKELKDVKSIFEPRIAVLEEQMKHVQGE